MRLQAEFSMGSKTLEADFGTFQNASDGGYERGLQEGRQAEYDRFWDAYQQNGNRTEYSNAFYGWTTETCQPKYDLKPVTADYMFAKATMDPKASLDERGVFLDTSNCTNINRMFVRADVQRVPVLDLRKATILTEVFQYAYVRTIDKIILNDTGDQNLNNFFWGTTFLKEVRFEGVIGSGITFKDTNVLSNESVQSIIDHLKDLTGATAQTLTLHNAVGSKLTDAQKAAVTAKNWTLVY